MGEDAWVGRENLNELLDGSLFSIAWFLLG